MKLIVEISDKEATFGMKVLKNLAFIKKVQPMSETGAQLFEELHEAAEQVRLHKKGAIKLKSAQDLLDEGQYFKKS